MGMLTGLRPVNSMTANVRARHAAGPKDGILPWPPAERMLLNSVSGTSPARNVDRQRSVSAVSASRHNIEAVWRHPTAAKHRIIRLNRPSPSSGRGPRSA